MELIMRIIQAHVSSLLLIFFGFISLSVNSVTFVARDYWDQSQVLRDKKIWVCVSFAPNDNQIFQYQTDNDGQFSLDESLTGRYMVAVVEDYRINISVPVKVPASSPNIEKLIFASSQCCHTRNVKDVENVNLQDLYNFWQARRLFDNFLINYIGGYLEAWRTVQKKEDCEKYDHPNNIAYYGFSDYLTSQKSH